MAVGEASVPPVVVPFSPPPAFERRGASSRGRSRTTSAKLERKRGGAWGEWWVRTNAKGLFDTKNCGLKQIVLCQKKKRSVIVWLGVHPCGNGGWLKTIFRMFSNGKNKQMPLSKNSTAFVWLKTEADLLHSCWLVDLLR